MGGAAVSSADGCSSGIELNAIQRSNPEMFATIRGLVESNENNRIHSRSRSWRTFKLSVRIGGRLVLI
jgi:hypothetical protein